MNIRDLESVVVIICMLLGACSLIYLLWKIYKSDKDIENMNKELEEMAKKATEEFKNLMENSNNKHSAKLYIVKNQDKEEK